MKKRIILTILSFFLSNSLFAETIMLKSGKEIDGKIIERTEEYIKVDFHAMPLTYYAEDIESINGKLFEESTAIDNTHASNKSAKTPKEIFKICSPAVVYIKTDNGFGSGFIIDKSGIVVTNYHVIGLTNNITITLKNGKIYEPVAILNYHIPKDLCLLKIDASRNLPFIPLGNDEDIEIGEELLTIGNPSGQKHSLSDGLVSQIQDTFNRKMIQFTCPISPGSSGGPLLNNNGEAVGIVTQVVLPSEGIAMTQNLNLAVAINEVKALIAKKRDISLPEFFVENNKNSPLVQAFFYTNNIQESLPILKSEVNNCANINSDYCSAVRIETLTRIDLMLNSYFEKIGDSIFSQRGTFNKQDVQELLRWSMEGMRIIKQGGGIQGMANSYESYFNSSEKGVKRMINYSFVIPFFTASFAYLIQGNENEANRYYKTINEYSPDSEWNRLLVELFEEFRKNGYIVKYNLLPNN